MGFSGIKPSMSKNPAISGLKKQQSMALGEEQRSQMISNIMAQFTGRNSDSKTSQSSAKKIGSASLDMNTLFKTAGAALSQRQGAGQKLKPQQLSDASFGAGLNTMA